MRARRIATLAVIGTMCACAVLEQMGFSSAPQWFIVIGTAVATEFIVEYWQEHRDAPTTPPAE